MEKKQWTTFPEVVMLLGSMQRKFRNEAIFVFTVLFSSSLFLLHAISSVIETEGRQNMLTPLKHRDYFELKEIG